MQRFILIIFSVFIFSATKAQTDSLSIKIGQMILIGLPGTEIDPKVLAEVKSGKVGSIIYFEKNIPAKDSYIRLKKMNWQLQEAAAIPLFICIDQEGGRVNRLKDKYGFPRSVTAEYMGMHGEDTTRFYAQTTAATLAGLGINVNFAPVVDLASNPDNPIIAKYGRAFSDDPQLVSRMAEIFAEEHNRFGVVSVLKHFPGHGSSKADTHLGIADVTKYWTEAELIPYQTLITDHKVDAVMTAHIVNKQLDKKELPGTLSKDIITGILRDQMRFNGVVFSDDMQMHAITKYYGLEEAIKLAINAGVDILTFSNNIQGSDERTVDVVHRIIRDLVERNEISAQRIDESFNRIMQLKSKLNQ
ncbi:MAG TPA: glycoside hydrolase family 3 N-terminal domain-containing protein [Cyclobacteriaceae bacterium]|nr:glycoside hydrolase family 3 N-terminal domain-containing protein [Cyclobacteriaceae bacterium]